MLPQCAGLPSRDDEAENCVSFEKYIDVDDYGENINELVISIRHKLKCVYSIYSAKPICLIRVLVFCP